MRRARLLAVAIHDVEPATFTRCVEIRTWLRRRGIGSVTLLVIPAADLHPFYSRGPQLVEWLRTSVERGDEIAQHGLQHRRARHARRPRRWLSELQGGSVCEFPGLRTGEMREAVSAGRRILNRAGFEPHGFVAPGYAYTRGLRRELADSFDWWAGLMRLHTAGPSAEPLAPAVGLGMSGPLKRAVSPLTARVGGLAGGRVLRLDVHPADLEDRRHRHTLEAILDRAAGRRAVTYKQVLE